MPDTLPTELDENCKPIFHTSPRTLLELASLRWALQIWLENFNQLYSHLNKNEYMDITDSKFQPEIESLTKVPIAIGKTVESWFPVIAKELNLWYRTFINDVRYFKSDDIYSRIDLVVFGGYGTIHFRDTIENFFKDDSLNNLTKFEMACVYCVEEKIDIFYPLVCDTLCSNGVVRFDTNRNYVMYYWICRKRGELSRIPLQGVDCIEHLMIEICSSRPIWLAIEYFLTFLDRNDRINQIDQLFEGPSYNKLAKYLLPYFEAPVQRHIIDNLSLRILYAFVNDNQMLDYAVQMWLHLRDFITNDQFNYLVINRFIHDRNGSNRTHVFKIIDYVFFETVLAEIWFHSPGHLKEFVLDFHFLDICMKMTYYRGDLLKNLSRDISFLLAMLSDADIALRKKFWDENWSKWIIGVPSAHLEQLMDLCLVDTEAIDEFKKQLKKSNLFEEYCDTLVTRGYHNELNDLLYCFCGDEGEKLNLKVALLTTNKHWKRCIFKPHNVEEIQKCSDFIDIILSNKILAENFKNQFIMSEDNLNLLYNKLDRKSFLDIEIIVETLLSSEKRVEMKEILLTRFRDMITKGELHKFDESDCQNFLTWCAEKDEQRVRNFVKSLPIEDIFQAAVSNCMKYEPCATYGWARFERKCTLEDLNKFLTWYFESPSLSETFKRERIQVYEGMLETEIESILGVDKETVIEEIKKELISDVEIGDRN